VTRRLLAIAAAFAITFSAIPANAVVPTWTTLIEGAPGGGYPVAIVQRDDASFVLLHGGNAAGDEACRLVRLDVAGSVTWNREVASGPNTDCAGMTGDDTGLYIAIDAIGRVDGVPGGDGWDTYVRKVDFDGGALWTRAFSTSNSEITNAIGVAGGVVAIGGWRFFSSSGRSDLAFVRTYDTDGNLGWTHLIDSDNDDHAQAVAVDASGVYAAVWLEDTESFSIRAFDGAGAHRWTTTLPDQSFVVAMIAGGDRLFAAGSTSGTFPGTVSAGSDDVFVATFDPGTGAAGWVRQFGSSGADEGNSVALGPAGVYVGGYTDGSLPRFESRGHLDAFVRSYGPNGKRRWTRQFGTHADDLVTALAADANGVTTIGITDGNLGTGHVQYSAAFIRRWQPA
jgi:hypothetical protein